MSDHLGTFLQQLQRLTGLEICLYDLTYFTQDVPELRVRREQRVHCSAYCELVKSSPAAWKQCSQTEHWRIKQAGTRQRGFIHTCHAGVTELVLPLRSGNRVIGALFLGQAFALPAAGLARILRRLGRQFALPVSRLTRMAAAQPRTTPAGLRRFEPVLRLVKLFIERTLELRNLREGFSAPEPSSSAPVTADNATVPLFFLADIQPDSPQIQRAVRWVAASYWKNPTQAGAAREAGLSPSQFSRRFRAETGQTFRAFLARARTEAAAYLLKRTGLNVSEVAARVGYENATSLQRAFKRRKGFSPRVFIRRQAL